MRNSISQSSLSTSQLSRNVKSPSTLRVGKRYRARRVAERYDTIVIGSGPSGLATAACLSKMGQKVAVFEQHYTAGGFTHAYCRNGFEWDVGVHFIPDVLREDHIFRQLFDFISDGNLKWAELQEKQFHLDFNEVSPIMLTMIAEKDKAILKQHFPEETDAIDAIYKLSRQIILRALPCLLLMKISGAGRIGQNIAALAAKLLPEQAVRTAYEVVSEYSDNEHFIQTMCGMWWPIFGITPSKLSFLYVAAFMNNRTPVAFPRGGSSEIAKTIIPVIQASGGEVFTYADVAQILVENNRATGVEMADGHHIYADAVVSSAGVFNTFQNLLPEEVAERAGYVKKLRRVKRTTGHFNLFVGFDASNEALGLESAEFLLMNSLAVENDSKAFESDPSQNIPIIFLTFPSAKDPDWEQRYPGKSTASAFVYIDNYSLFERWQDTQWDKRGTDYEALKEDIAQRILSALYERFPQLRDRVAYYELSTPLSTRNFCKYENGEIFGLDHTAERLKQGWLQPTTRIPGLYLTGQDILLVSHCASAFSGALTAGKILGLSSMVSMWRRIRTRKHRNSLTDTIPFQGG